MHETHSRGAASHLEESPSLIKTLKYGFNSFNNINFSRSRRTRTEGSLNTTQNQSLIKSLENNRTKMLALK